MLIRGHLKSAVSNGFCFGVSEKSYNFFLEVIKTFVNHVLFSAVYIVVLPHTVPIKKKIYIYVKVFIQQKMGKCFTLLCKFHLGLKKKVYIYLNFWNFEATVYSEITTNKRTRNFMSKFIFLEIMCVLSSLKAKIYCFFFLDDDCAQIIILLVLFSVIYLFFLTQKKNILL